MASIDQAANDAASHIASADEADASVLQGLSPSCVYCPPRRALASADRRAKVYRLERQCANPLARTGAEKCGTNSYEGRSLGNRRIVVATHADRERVECRHCLAQALEFLAQRRIACALLGNTIERRGNRHEASESEVGEACDERTEGFSLGEWDAGLTVLVR